MNAIGEFVAVVEDVGASRGVMVCRSAFAKDAKTDARNKGIALYNLHDAESRDWRLELTIPLLWIDLHPRPTSLAASTSTRASSSPSRTMSQSSTSREAPAFTRLRCSSSSGTSVPSPTPPGSATPSSRRHSAHL